MVRARRFMVGVVAMVLLVGCASDDADGEAAGDAPAEVTDESDADGDGADEEAAAADDGAAAGASGTATLVVDGTSHDLTEFETCEAGPSGILDVVGTTADGSASFRGTVSMSDIGVLVIETPDGQFVARARDGDFEGDIEGSEASVTGEAVSGDTTVGFELTAACG